MSKETMRTHVVIPTELVASIDQIVGRRGRSKFLADAAEKELRRIKLSKVAHRLAGSLADRAISGWESPDAAYAWVRKSRKADEQRLEQLLDQPE